MTNQPDTSTLQPLRFGLSTPGDLWTRDLPSKQQLLQQVSDAGFDHLFMADHVSFRDGSGNDGFVEVAALSQLHPTLGVMISIYLLPLRHPLPVARQLATMDRIAPGRMTFGIGVGGDDRHEIEVCGVDPSTRGRRTDEMLQIIRRLLDGETLDFNGDHFQLQQAAIKPRPASPIPVIVGGRSNAALRRTARFGEGWIGVWCSPRRYREAVEIIADQAQACGRQVNWLHGYQPWIGVDSDPQVARAAVQSQMEAFYKLPFSQFERYTPYGTPEQVAQQLAEYADCGARLFNLKVCTRDKADEVAMGAAVRQALLQQVRATE